jgi:membrane-bound lytic murein transglycosylase D
VRAVALLSLILLASTAARADEFTRVPALESNVAFWKKVYIEWGLNQIAFHDEEDLGLIYRVIAVPARGAKNAAGVTRGEAIKRGQSEVESALKSLAKKNPKSADGLAGVEREVYLNIKDHPRADKYNRLAKVRVQNGLRERFVQGFGNSGLYDKFIRAELKENGLPEELIGIAFVESLFYVGAKSKVGAAGVWQFMSYTGKEYMQLNGVVDERWDPILATEAACKYLKQAKKELGTWPLAITSYNYGRAGMRGLADGAGSRDFGTILAVSKNKRFGFAARNYYASFLAVHDIITNPDRYLKGVARKPAWSYDVIRLPFPVFATQIEATGVFGGSTLDSLNPALTSEAEAGKVPLSHGMSLRVPKGKGAELIAKLSALPERERNRALVATKGVHTCNGKQTVTEIAKKYGLPAEQLTVATGLTSADVPKKGERLPIPVASARYTLFPEARGMPVPAAPAPVRILLADATAAPAADEPEVAPIKPERPAKVEKPAKPPKVDVTLASVVQGTVTASRIRVSAIVDELPAVDMIAGVDTASLPVVDVVAGDPGLDAPWSTLPVREGNPERSLMSGEAAPTS